MTFSIGTTPASATIVADRLEDGAEAAERAARHIPERRQDRVLGERAGLARIDDGS